MNWKAAFSTAIGRKLLMGATGLFLVTFLIVHCYINAQVFYNDGGANFNVYAHFMGTNPIIRIIEIGLMVFLLWHIILGLQLWFKNMGRRTVKYAVKPGNSTSRWYSRSMGILGTLILLFLILHLSAFWIPNRASQITEGEELDLFSRMAEAFSNPIIVVVYVLGCISLGWHLAHGFYSAMQTFGLTTHRYKGMIKSLGFAFSIIVPLVFALMPLWFYGGHAGWFDTGSFRIPPSGRSSALSTALIFPDMDNLFLDNDRSKLIQRIHRLTPETKAQWGKMNAAQMVTHLRLPLEVGMGKLELPSVFMMKIFGPMIRKIIFSEKPIKKNSPTAKNFVILDERDFEAEKRNLLNSLEEFAATGNKNELQPRHKYFGKMNKEDWNHFQQRHFDHHLTQFGV